METRRNFKPEENARLKKLVAKLSFDNTILKDVAEGIFKPGEEASCYGDGSTGA